MFSIISKMISISTAVYYKPALLLPEYSKPEQWRLAEIQFKIEKAINVLCVKKSNTGDVIPHDHVEREGTRKGRWYIETSSNVPQTPYQRPYA